MNCLDAHLCQIVCDKDGDVDWCIVLLEMPLTRFEECWPLPTESLLELLKNLNIVFLVDCLSSGNPVRVDHASAVKKVTIKSMWVDLLCLAFLGQGDPACFHWELCLLVLGS